MNGDPTTAAGSTFWGLLEAVPDAMVVTGTDGRIQVVNEETLSLFGYARNELIGQPVEVLLPDRFREAHPGHRRGYVSDQKRRHLGTGLALFGRRKDGTEFPADISLARTQSAEGVVVIAAVRDITGRKHADETRARLAAIVDSSDDAIIGSTLDGVVTSWNKGAEQVFGYSAEEIVGKKLSPLFPASCRDEEALMLKRLEKGERIEHFESVRMRKDGREIDVSVSLSLVLDSAGAIIGASKIARDITEVKQTQRALARAKDAAEAANRELESFSYSVAHDLRAPLRSIDGFSLALLEDYGEKLDAGGKKYLSLVRESAQRMAQLIDDLLALSRVTRSELHREGVDLSTIARGAIARLQRSQPDRQVDVVIEEGLAGEGDPRLLAVVLDNLLGNAWKFTGKREDARIHFGATSKDGHPVYFVRDNGAGFDMAFADKLFGVFQRLHAVAEFEGTGVGLATVQRVVSRHGGRVWAEGEVNRGATFYFTLDERERMALNETAPVRGTT